MKTKVLYNAVLKSWNWFFFFFFFEVLFLLLENRESVFCVFLFFVHSRFFLWLLSEEIGLPTSFTKSQNWVTTINKNIFNNFLIAATAPYFFKNCQVPHPHLNPEMHSCFIFLKRSYPWLSFITPDFLHGILIMPFLLCIISWALHVAIF